MLSLRSRADCLQRVIALFAFLIALPLPGCELQGEFSHLWEGMRPVALERRCMRTLAFQLRGGAAHADNDGVVTSTWFPGSASNTTGQGSGNGEAAAEGSMRKNIAKRKRPEPSHETASNGIAHASPSVVKSPRPAFNFSRAPRDGSCLVTLSLLSKTKFAASFKAFPAAVIDMCKRFKAQYEPQQKRWTMPMFQYDQFLAALSELQRGADVKMPIKIDAIPDTIRAALRTAVPPNQTAIEELYKTIPDTLRESLMPFQQEGVRFGLARNGRVLIGDEMGLGKTIQAIALCSVYLSDWPMLVICPSSMRMMWHSELLKWLPGLLTREDINVIFAGKDAVERRAVTIVSYDLFNKLKAPLSALSCGLVIADEAHYLKNGQAKRTQSILPFLRAARRAMILTGTPALSRPAELFTLVHAVEPLLFPEFMSFAYRYCDAKQGPFGLDTGGSSNLAELHLVLQEHAMVRRLKRDVLTQLPPKTRQRVFVRPDPPRAARIAADLRRLGELEAQSVDPAVPEGERAGAEAAKRSLIMKIYVDTGQAKLDAVGQYVGDLIEGGAKFLVFAHHIQVLDGLEAVVKGKKVGYIRIDGATDARLRQAHVASFQSDPAVRVAVLSVTAAGAGLTLTAAQTVVFAELHWVPGALLQAEDRVHRIGQNESVNIHYLVAQGTCDDIMWEAISRKLAVVGRALDGQFLRLNALRVDAPHSPAPASALAASASPDATGNGGGGGGGGSAGPGGVWQRFFAAGAAAAAAAADAAGSTGDMVGPGADGGKS